MTTSMTTGTTQPARAADSHDNRHSQIRLISTRIRVLEERLTVLERGEDSGVERRLLAHYQHRLASEKRILSKLKSLAPDHGR